MMEIDTSEMYDTVRDYRTARYATRKLRNWRSNKHGPHNRARRSGRIVQKLMRKDGSSKHRIDASDINLMESSSLEMFPDVDEQSHNMDSGLIDNSRLGQAQTVSMSFLICGGSGVFATQEAFSVNRGMTSVAELERYRHHNQLIDASASIDAHHLKEHLKDECDKVKNGLRSRLQQVLVEQTSLQKATLAHTRALKHIRESFYEESFDVILGLEALRGQDDSIRVAESKIVEVLSFFAHCKEELQSERKRLRNCLRDSALFLELPHRLRSCTIDFQKKVLPHPVFMTYRIKPDSKTYKNFRAKCHQTQTRAAELQALMSRSSSLRDLILESDRQREKILQEHKDYIECLRNKSADATELQSLGRCLLENCAQNFREVCPFSVPGIPLKETECFVDRIRDLFLRQHGATIRRHLFLSFPMATTLELVPAPVACDVQERFLDRWKNREGPSIDMVPAFHGTNVANLPSIFERGLLIPGKGNHLIVVNGAVHGRGIYAAKVSDHGRDLSVQFARKNARGLLLCAVLDDALSVSQYQLGYRMVTAESKNVRHVGAAFVIFDPCMILPLFQVHDEYAE